MQGRKLTRSGWFFKITIWKRQKHSRLVSLQVAITTCTITASLVTQNSQSLTSHSNTHHSRAWHCSMGSTPSSQEKIIRRVPQVGWTIGGWRNIRSKNVHVRNSVVFFRDRPTKLTQVLTGRKVPSGTPRHVAQYHCWCWQTKTRPRTGTRPTKGPSRGSGDWQRRAGWD